MALDHSEQQLLAEHLSKLDTAEQKIAQLALESGVRLPSQPDKSSGYDIALSILQLAEKQGQMKAFLKKCLQAFPGDQALRDVLSGDPRFLREAKLNKGASWLQVAMGLREALRAWEPTHVLALDDSLQQLGTLLAGVLEEAQLVSPPRGDRSTEALWSQLKTYDDDLDPSRIVLLAHDRQHLQVALQLFERSNMVEGLQIRPVGPAQLDRTLPRALGQ